MDREKYFKLLATHKNNIDGNLLKYFGGNHFFYDGTLNSMNFHIDKSLLNMNLNCPNHQDSDGNFLNIAFRISFVDVTSFEIQYKNNSKEAYSEVRSYEIENITKNNDFFSLKIDFASYCIQIESIYIEIEPEEPLAYKLLVDSGKILEPLVKDWMKMINTKSLGIRQEISKKF